VREVEPTHVLTRRVASCASPVVAPVVSAALATVAVLAGWRGTDLAAQVFRADLFRRYGFALWNGQWFGGHATLGYSVVAPMVSAVVGPVTVAVGSGVVAAVLFDRVIGREFGTTGRIGSWWFAVGTAVNVVIGRVPFALGLACGLMVIWALQRHHLPLAVAAAAVTALTSPVAAVCVVVAIVAWAAPLRRWWMGGILALAVMVPLLGALIVFPDGGVFPYEPWALAVDLVIAAAVFLAAGRAGSALRTGAVLYAVIAVAAFVVPTALGGNISRFSQFAAGPVLACLLWPRRKAVLGVLALPLLCWQWTPAVQTIVAGPEQLESSRTYYQPVVDYVLAQGPVPGRLEVLQTARHWEAAYVADFVPLPRGWERQLDLAYNHVFYDGTLNAATYEQWLQDNAVQYVALPDAHLDDSSIPERQLVEQGLDFLAPVWQNAHWRVWRFTGYTGLVDGPATVIRQNAIGFVLRVDAPGAVQVRVRSSPHWNVSGSGCVAPSGDGWIRLENLKPGIVELTQQWSGSACPS
jgi:hypothetical protein